MALAFFPDGRRLVSGSVDTTALVWDVAALAREPPTARLAPDEATRLWADLAGEAPAALRAVGRWAAAPKLAVTFLRDRLRPITAVPLNHVTPLVADLDSPAFATREAASKALVQFGPGAEATLRVALTKVSSAEVKRRAQAVLDAWEHEWLRTGRAVEVLEAIATADARALLAELAQGDPSARLTIDSKASLERLTGR
jgi:hypothetical protein